MSFVLENGDTISLEKAMDLLDTQQHEMTIQKDNAGHKYKLLKKSNPITN